MVEDAIPQEWNFNWAIAILLDAALSAVIAALTFWCMNLLIMPWSPQFIGGFVLGVFCARLRPLVVFWIREVRRTV